MAEAEVNPFRSPNQENSQSDRRSWTRRLVGAALVLLLIVMLLAMIAPVHRGSGSRIAARRTSCKNNLRQIAIAIHNYESEHGTLPPAFTVDADGNPLHSWRVLILPYLELGELYKSIDLTKPWNDPANTEARKNTPVVFRCPSCDSGRSHTNYLANVGDKGSLVPGQGRSLKDFKDGTSESILAFEVGDDLSVEWMSPQDGNFETFRKVFDHRQMPHISAVNVAMADASCRSLEPTSDSELDYRPYFTIADGDKAKK
jgi:hypothetical protein